MGDDPDEDPYGDNRSLDDLRDDDPDRSDLVDKESADVALQHQAHVTAQAERDFADRVDDAGRHSTGVDERIQGMEQNEANMARSVVTDQQAIADYDRAQAHAAQQAPADTDDEEPAPELPENPY